MTQIRGSERDVRVWQLEHAGFEEGVDHGIVTLVQVWDLYRINERLFEVSTRTMDANGHVMQEIRKFRFDVHRYYGM